MAEDRIATEDRPVSLPFVRSPSDVAHERIKGPYGPEDAVTPGEAIGEDRHAEEDGLVESAGNVQSPEEAAEAELSRRASMSEVELEEAEARDRLARALLETPAAGTLNTPERVDSKAIKERLDNEVPAVGADPDNDANQEGAPVNEGQELEGQRIAREIAQAKNDAGKDHENEPVLGPDFSKLESDEESDEKERDAAVSVSESPRKQGDEVSDSLEASEDAADVSSEAKEGNSEASARGFGPAYGRGE
jgi:hypothetical protein